MDGLYDKLRAEHIFTFAKFHSHLESLSTIIQAGWTGIHFTNA